MNVTIKDLPAQVHRKLKARAAANKRSLNWEVIDILEKAVTAQPIKIEEILADIERIQADIKLPPLTEDLLRTAKNQGRP